LQNRTEEGKTKHNKLIIWGAGGHAKVVADIIRLEDVFEVAGFLDGVDVQRHGENFCSARILGGGEQLELLRQQGIKHAIVAIGDNRARLRLADKFASAGFELAIAIHPRAIVATDITIGAGTVIAAGAVLNPGCTIGRNVIINTAASVDHDCNIGHGSHISPGAHIAGNVTIGSCAWVGLGASIIEKVQVGDDALVGAGALVIRNVPSGVVVAGHPATPIESTSAHG
jgi:UDP-N-acetylbacillosamine N-acetyltransferase